VSKTAIAAMKEIGIDISGHSPKSIDKFLSLPLGYVITVCDNAKETWPVFSGPVQHRIHHGFRDPAGAVRTESEIMEEFRRVRDEIHEVLREFYSERISPQQLL
jgi:arsenate reductase